MGFGAKWMQWMELLVFKSSMSVVVNGSPTKEFIIQRALRQGDPLSPFLFVLIAEGLTGLVRKSIEVGEFQSFSIKDSCKVDILQFADDTLIVGDDNWKHVRAIKEVLRAFEIVSGLGIPIGFNPRKEATWNPLVLNLKNQLEGWKNRYLNLGGRITLLKVVLSSLAIFTMSFYKMPRIVSRYGDLSSFIMGGGKVGNVSSSFSVWWKDLIKSVPVAAMGGWRDNRWCLGDLGLNVGAMREVGFSNILDDLKGRLEVFGGRKEGKDSVAWRGNSESIFSVSPCYKFYDRLRIPFGPPIKNEEAFGFLWKVEVPFKIKAFGWRLFRNKLPTKDLLVTRGTPLSFDNLNCVLCGNCEENMKHLFFSCLVVKKVWRGVALWVGLGDIGEEDGLENFMFWHRFFRCKRVKERKLGVVWLATNWTIWLLRNGVSFRKDK
ncbi:uncharacterized protein LOC131650953 [Vicia villosa]|uniref:uncharacterized protein LOC131650953 n=1 Tax=Vicia villosa TaxID=3911 RepID=UPI00273CC2BD|nr:uncharacterized protein LOC131650953 [Vicia villosa]